MPISRVRNPVLLTTTLLIVVIIVPATGTTVAQTAEAPDCSTVTYSGEGTTTNPYEVSNADQLQCIGDANTSTEMNDSYVLVSDIEASGTPGWNGGDGFDPIGNVSTETVVAFDGSFDGSGHSITGLTIKRSNETGVGLFRVIGDTGKVTNVSLTDVDIRGSPFTGGLAGGNTDGGEAKGVRVTGEVSGSIHVGGIVGVNGGTVKGLSANVEVNASDNVGGLVGSNPNDSTVTESHSEGAVDGVESVGGLVGSNGGIVDGSYSKAEVEGGDGIGGLVGFNNDNGTVTESYATGAVTGDEPRGLQAGGLVGRNSGAITQSYARGMVEGSDGVGGLVGVNEDGTVKESYAIGAVTGDEQVGGLVGFSDGDSVIDSYWDTNMTGHSSSSGGTALTTGEMTGHGTPGNVTGFSFEETWRTTDKYPQLAWQAEEAEDSKEDGDDSAGSERLPGFTAVTALLTLLTVEVVLLERS